MISESAQEPQSYGEVCDTRGIIVPRAQALPGYIHQTANEWSAGCTWWMDAAYGAEQRARATARSSGLILP
jgi:hypothetical protein